MSNQDREIRVLGLDDLEVRHSGRKDEEFTVQGYAAKYNETSYDLGGFREQIAPGAFDEVLATNPDVVFAWDHDTRYIGARTSSKDLTLRSDSIGLHVDARVSSDYSWAKDLHEGLKRGHVKGGSFAFSVPDGGDVFSTDDNGNVMRTINRVGDLFDVTVTAQPAYPQTSMAAMRSLAAATGRPPETVEAKPLVASEQETAEQGQHEESHKGSVEATEEFMRWKEARIKKAAAHQSTLAKLAERLEKLE